MKPPIKGKAASRQRKAANQGETASVYAKSGVVSSAKPLKPTRESLADLENLYLHLHWICSPHDLAGTKRLVKSVLKACRSHREREKALCRMIIDATKQIQKESAQ
jgi:hypothetical protein